VYTRTDFISLNKKNYQCDICEEEEELKLKERQRLSMEEYNKGDNDPEFPMVSEDTYPRFDKNNFPTMTFSLVKSIFRDNYTEEPDYRGTFEVKQSILFQFGAKYTIEGVEQTDGSINLKFERIE
jgi:hypothetical protein